VARKLMEKGYTKVYALKGGWHEWSQAKFPVEEK
jgi:rhodanese-related sulfurtransferase